MQTLLLSYDQHTKSVIYIIMMSWYSYHRGGDNEVCWVLLIVIVKSEEHVCWCYIVMYTGWFTVFRTSNEKDSINNLLCLHVCKCIRKRVLCLINPRVLTVTLIYWVFLEFSLTHIHRHGKKIKIFENFCNVAVVWHIYRYIIEVLVSENSCGDQFCFKLNEDRFCKCLYLLSKHKICVWNRETSSMFINTRFRQIVSIAVHMINF